MNGIVLEPFTSEDRQMLLQLARATLIAHTRREPLPSTAEDGALARHAGAFVSLHTGDELRGCIGHIEANQPLAQVIVRCTVAACSEDPRFPAVREAELPHVAIEVSVLGTLQPVAAADDIVIGRHGLLVELGWHRGLLLPQVATSWGWDAATFIAQTCRKAGVPTDAWRTGATVWKFEAEVFGERS